MWHPQKSRTTYKHLSGCASRQSIYLLSLIFGPSLNPDAFILEVFFFFKKVTSYDCNHTNAAIWTQKMAESRDAVVDDDADAVQSVSGGGDHFDVGVYHKRFSIISGERMKRVQVLVGHAETNQVSSLSLSRFLSKARHKLIQIKYQMHRGKFPRKLEQPK